MHHLNLSHDRLLSTYRANDGDGLDNNFTEVSVSVCEEFRDRTDPAVNPDSQSTGAEVPKGFVWMKQREGWSLADGIAATEDQGQHMLLKNALQTPSAKTRQYYRIGSRRVMSATQESDSEDEEDIELNTKILDAALDDFSDVNLSEKRLMKLWNRHVLKYPIVADSHSRALCEIFIDENSGELKGLRNNFMLHLSTMARFGALRLEDMLGVIEYWEQTNARAA